MTQLDLRQQYIDKYLTHDIRFGNTDDDRDQPWIWPQKFTQCVWDQYGIELHREFSDCNQYALLSEFMKIRDTAKVIVEVGVARLSTNLYEHTSTTVILNNKKEETIYLGIDIEDKKFLESQRPNVHTLLSKSEDYEVVKKKLEEVGIEKIDFLFIDGWHSTNQVIDELFYVDYLAVGGILGYHDTNYHPGPSRIVEALREDMFDVRKHCTSKADYGISFATRKS